MKYVPVIITHILKPTGDAASLRKSKGVADTVRAKTAATMTAKNLNMVSKLSGMAERWIFSPKTTREELLISSFIVDQPDRVKFQFSIPVNVPIELYLDIRYSVVLKIDHTMVPTL